MNKQIQKFVEKYKIRITKLINSNYYAFLNIAIIILSAISLSDVKPVRKTFTTFWGLYDVCVLIISIISLFGFLNFNSVRLWLIIKYLDKVPGLEFTSSICSALKKSMKIIKDIGIFAIFFFTCTGILAVSFWGGKMSYYCVDKNGKIFDSNRLCSTSPRYGRHCPANYTCQKLDNPGNPGTISFDNIFISWLNIFQVLTTEGWSDIYFKVSDISSKFSLLFFIFIIICGNWLLLQLIVATVVQSLKSQVIIKRKYNITRSKTVVLDDDPKHSKLKNKMANFINNHWVERGILVITIIDTIFISMVNSNISGKLSSFIIYTEIVCTSIFAIEMLIKTYVLGIIGYWKSSFYNVMDGVFTIFSILEIIFSNDYGIAVFRILRAFRILRLTKFLPQLSNLISVFCDSAKPLFSLFVIWILSIVIFSLFTIQFFEGGMNISENRPKNNIENFYYSFLSVVQLYTVENWDSIKDNVYESKGIYATLIPVIIIIVGAYIFSQFLVAILLSAFIDRLQTDKFYKKIFDRKSNTKHVIKYVIDELFEPNKKDKEKENENSKSSSNNTNNDNNNISTGKLIESSENASNKQEENNQSKGPLSIIKREELLPKSFSYPLELNNSTLNRSSDLLTPFTNNPNTTNFEILSQISNQSRNNRKNQVEIDLSMPMFDICDSLHHDGSEPTQSSPTETDTPNTSSFPQLQFDNNEISSSNTPNESKKKYTIKISDAKIVKNLTSAGKTNVPHVFSEVIKDNEEASKERKKILNEESERIEKQNYPTSPKLLKRLFSLKKRKLNNKNSTNDSTLENHFEDSKDIITVKTEEGNDLNIPSFDITEVKTYSSLDKHNDILEINKQKKGVAIEKTSIFMEKLRKIHKIYRDSFFVHICYKTIKNDVYFYFVALVTIASCISLALETPNPHESKNYDLLYKCDIFYTVVFIFDLILSIIAFGAIFTRHAFLKKLYNWVDVVVVLISLLNVLNYGNNFHSLRIFRLVRILKFFKIHDGLRIVSTSVWRTIPSLFIALIPYIFYILICSSVSLSLFVNRGWECNDDSVLIKSECIGNFTNDNGVMEARVWQPYPVTYDNFVDSILSSFIISHQEAWPDIMYRYMVSVDPSDISGGEHHLGYSIFFVISVLIGNWLFLSVVTALIFNNLRRNRDILRGIQYLSDGQRKLLDYIKLIITNKPNFPLEKSKSSFRNKIRHFIDTNLFSRISFIIIGLNVIVMMLDCANNNDIIDNFINYSEYVFIVLYTIEVILLLYGYGIVYFFKDYWNIFSFGIVVASIISLFYNSSTSPIIFSSIRLLRILRIIKYAKGLKALGIAIIFNFTQLFNVLFLMFIVCYVFAVIGYHYFGNINVKYTNYLNEQLNFSSFGNSLVSVFIFCTGEGWPFALADCSGKSIHHSCNPNTDNCGSKWAIVYFITLQVIFNWILLNSFIAITVDTFITVLEEHDEIVRLEKVWNTFNQQWIKYDWNKSGDLTFVELINMYNSFKLPKGTEWGNQNRSNGILLVKPPMEELFKNVKVYKNRCKYHDVIFGFLNSWMGEELPESFLIREKEKFRTGYEKKVFEKRRNSIYNFDNDLDSNVKTKREMIWEKSKTIYNNVAKALSLRSSNSNDTNIHILVETVDNHEDDDATDDDNTLNSDSFIGLNDDYIRMNMHTCNGRLQNVYTNNILTHQRRNISRDHSNIDTPTTITPSATPTTNTTIFNLFDSTKNDFSSDTLNELSRSSGEKDKKKETQKESEQKNENEKVREIKNEHENKKKEEIENKKEKGKDKEKENECKNEMEKGKRKEKENECENEKEKDKGKEKENESENEKVKENKVEKEDIKNKSIIRSEDSQRVIFKCNSSSELKKNEIPNEGVFCKPEDKPKTKETIRRNSSQRKLRRNSTSLTIDSQDPNLIGTDGIITNINNESYIFRKPEDPKHRKSEDSILRKPDDSIFRKPDDSIFRKPDDKLKGKRRDSNQRSLKRNSTYVTIGSQNPNLLRTDSVVNMNNDAILRIQEGEDRYKNRGPLRHDSGPLRHDNVSRNHKRSATTISFGNQNPNLLRTDSIVNMTNESILCRQEDDKFRNRGHKLKGISTSVTISNLNFLHKDSIINNDPHHYRPVNLNPHSNKNSNTNTSPPPLNITNNNLTNEPLSYDSGAESNNQSSNHNDSKRSSEDQHKVSQNNKVAENRLGVYPLEEEKSVPSSSVKKEETVNFVINKRSLKNNKYKTVADFNNKNKIERLTLNNIGRSKSYDSNLNIYRNSPQENDILRNIIELDAIIGVDDEEEEKKNKHRSIHIKNNLHRIKSKTSFRMGFKDNYLDNDILIDVNNQGLPFHIVYAIYQIQQKFKKSKREEKIKEITARIEASRIEEEK